MTNGAGLHAPHRAIDARDASERFAIDLFDSLWARYRERMTFVPAYEGVVASHGATFANDHVAFRTIAWQTPGAGVHAVARVFEALGYRHAGCYVFPDKHLSSIHYRHPNPALPRLFVSELLPFELEPQAIDILERILASHRPPWSDRDLAALRRVGEAPGPARAELLDRAVRFFSDLPWDVPQRRDVLALAAHSQFGAWVALNGYDVNHFTASVDSHGAASLDDIEKTVTAMRAAGIPMKDDIEGARGSRLRQSSTAAVHREFAVMDDDTPGTLSWTYAYFEIAERPLTVDPATGEASRFDGFLGAQATHLFEMTRVAPR